MKSLIGALAALAIVGAGCVGVVRVPGAHAERAEGKRCPPGHEWSDGQCHSKGKGHDKHH